VAAFTNAQPTGVARSGPCTAALDLRPAGAAASGIVPRRASADRRRDELALVLHALCESLGLVAAKAMSRSRAPRSPPTAHLRRPPSAGSTTPPATACWDLANSARCSRAPPAQSETVGAGAIMLVPQRMQGSAGRRTGRSLVSAPPEKRVLSPTTASKSASGAGSPAERRRGRDHVRAFLVRDILPARQRR
jgi:hypothetical protein